MWGVDVLNERLELQKVKLQIEISAKKCRLDKSV